MFVETKPEGESGITNKWRNSLLRAAELIERNGWCQGKPHNDAGEHCLLGAIFFSHYGFDAPEGTCPREWHEVFEIMKPHTDRNIADWNDDPEREKAEIIAALRAAAQS